MRINETNRVHRISPSGYILPSRRDIPEQAVLDVRDSYVDRNGEVQHGPEMVLVDSDNPLFGRKIDIRA